MKRSGLSTTKSSGDPKLWIANENFNPFIVRSKLGSLHHAIAPKVRRGTYVFEPMVEKHVPKPGGGLRKLSISTLPDAAVSYWLGRRLVQRNSFRFSSYSYAYRTDRNAHHAISHLMTEIRGAPRVFAVEYDFSKFFDNIDHDYLLGILRRYFQVSSQELQLIETFLKNRAAASEDNYVKGIFEVRSRGIPQGSTLSLFLANVVCYELDRELEKAGIVFARYADDTVILSDSYERAHRCGSLIEQHGTRAGPAVNHEKSPGISLLSNDGSVRNAEMKAKSEIGFLGHSLSPNGVALSHKSVERIRSRVLRIIYDNLLLQPKRGAFNLDRVGVGYYDWDLANTVNELRRYIYGPLSESRLRDALENRTNLTVPRGAVAFYPLLDARGEDQLRAIDGWMVDALRLAYAHRRRHLDSEFGVPVAELTREELISGSWYRFPKIALEPELPSFMRGLRYVKKAARIFGLKRLPSPQSGYAG